MSSVADIISELNDHGFTDTTTTRKVAVINDTIWEICSREPWPFLEKSIDLTFNGSSAVPTNAPTDFRAVLAMVDATTGLALEPWRLDDFTREYGSRLTEGGSPRLYTFLAKQLNFWPVPAASDVVRMRYIHTPAAVTDATNEAGVILPKQHHRLIVLGSLWKLYDMEDDSELAARFEQHFENRMMAMREDLWQSQYDRPDFIHVDDGLLDFDFYVN